MLYENELEALRITIESSGKTYKEVANFIFSHLKPQSAYSRLMNSLAEGKEEKLSFKQIIDLCKFCKRYEALFYMSEQCGFEEPKPKPIDDAETKLLNELIKTKEYLQEITQRIEKTYIQKYQITAQK